MAHFLTGVAAIFAGVAVTIVLSYGADAIMRRAGLLGKALPLTGSARLILIIIAYRTAFNVLGCYVVAKIAPSHPMAFALGLGVFGTLASIGGTFAKKDQGPAWYGWTLAALTVPAALLGGVLATR